MKKNGGRFHKDKEPKYGEPFYGEYMSQYISKNYHPGDKVRIKIWYITEPYDELQDVETKELAEQRASKFISPEKCLTWLSENHVLELLEEQQPEGYEEMIQQLQVLERYWKQGFYVYSWG